MILAVANRSRRIVRRDVEDVVICAAADHFFDRSFDRKGTGMTALIYVVTYVHGAG